MTLDQLIQKINKGESIEVKEQGSFENATIKINRAFLEDTDSPKTDHPIVASINKKDGDNRTVLLALDVTVKYENGDKIDSQIVGFLLDQNGNPAYYPGRESKGKYYPESFLHEIVRRICEFDEKQKEDFEFQPYKFNIGSFKNKLFKIEARRVAKEGEFVDILTDYRRVKMEEYNEKLQDEKTDKEGITKFEEFLNKEDGEKSPF